MQFLNNISINRKLTVLVAGALIVALTMASAAYLVNHVIVMRESMVRQLAALADVLGSNSTAALTFQDNEAAEGALSSLRMQPMVETASIYDVDGAVFAKYTTPAAQGIAADAPKSSGHQFVDGHLVVTQRIQSADEIIGWIRLQANLDLIHAELIKYGWIVLGVLVISFAAAQLLASRLQRIISEPILALAGAAQKISSEQDYSIRVTRKGNDELGALYDQFNRMLDQVERGKAELEQAHDELESRVNERTKQLSDANLELSKEVAERRRAETKLEEVHQELVTSARRAGMAEIATGVLHNVGNVLNSVNVSATLVSDQLRTSKRGQLDRVVEMLQSHGEDLGQYVTDDEKGKQIPNFLKLLSEHLASEERTLLEEMHSLTESVQHIKTIVSTQQSYTGVSGMVEPINIAMLMDDAVRLNSTSFERHRIHVERDIADMPTLLVDKQRILQIMINLIKNAKDALVEQHDQERILTLRAKHEDDRLIIQIADTGVGIKPENLTKVFSHGFTTKPSGHGFGLHSCANAATEMEGSLTVRSDGYMQGATFSLSLPFQPATTAVTS